MRLVYSEVMVSTWAYRGTADLEAGNKKGIFRVEIVTALLSTFISTELFYSIIA